jgi:hypothetical protein
MDEFRPRCSKHGVHARSVLEPVTALKVPMGHGWHSDDRSLGE